MVHVAGGLGFESNARGISASLSPGALAAWPLLFVALAASLAAPSSEASVGAPWWRRSCAFYVDFVTLFAFATVPFCLLALVIEHGSLPPPWEFSRSESHSTDILLSVGFFPVFAFLWAGLGLAFHKRITTPGALAFNVQLDPGKDVPLWRLAVFGVFGYYGQFIPLFSFLAYGLTPRAFMRAA